MANTIIGSSIVIDGEITGDEVHLQNEKSSAKMLVCPHQTLPQGEVMLFTPSPADIDA